MPSNIFKSTFSKRFQLRGNDSVVARRDMPSTPTFSTDLHSGTPTLASTDPDTALLLSTSEPTSPTDQSLVAVPSTSTAGRSTAFYNGAKLTVLVAGSVGEVVPFAGGALKAIAGVILAILNNIDEKSKNKRTAARLVRKLETLQGRIEQARTLGNYEAVNPHLAQLTRQLEEVHAKIRRTQNQSERKWLSVINSADIAEDLRECEDDISTFLDAFHFSATAKIEGRVNALSSQLSEFQAQIALQQSHCLNAPIHSSQKETIDFIDIRGNIKKVSLSFCSSYKDFQAFLKWDFGVNSDVPRRGALYVESEQYLLTSAGKELSPDDPTDWTRMLVSARPLEMFIVLVEPKRFSHAKRCPRCNSIAKNGKDAETTSWYCVSCGLECQKDRRNRNAEHEGEGDIDFFSRFHLVKRSGFLKNPLAGMGLSDEEYSCMLQAMVSGSTFKVPTPESSSP